MRRRHRTKLGTLKADLEQMRDQLSALLNICREAGVRVESAADDSVAGVPPSLIAASRTVRSAGGEPVTLIFPGDRRMLAVVSGGDPESILAEASRLGPSEAAGGVLRLGYARLVSGLDAVAVPQEGTVALTVSRALRPAEQRVAVRTAMRAARRAGWLPSRVPAWIALPLIFRKHGLAVVSAKVHAVIAGATAVAAGGVAAAALIALPHHAAIPPAARHHAAPRTSQRHGIQPVLRVVAHHRHHRGPRAAVAAAGSQAPQPVTSSAAAPPSPQPSSSPAPAVSASASVTDQVCTWVLGLKVCVPA